MAFVRGDSLALPQDNLGVAVCRGAFGSHIGIVFNSAKDGVRVLHLHSHLTVRSDEFSEPGNHRWVGTIVKLPNSLSKQMVAITRSIAAKKPHIPYGLKFLAARGSFDETGRYKAPKGSDGLTCASFVSTVFRDHRAPLIEERTWQSTAENVTWGEAVCNWLLESQAGEDHVAAVREGLNGLRVRPEDVAAAADTDFRFRPVDFLMATTGAPAVMNALYTLVPN